MVGRIRFDGEVGRFDDLAKRLNLGGVRDFW